MASEEKIRRSIAMDALRDPEIRDLERQLARLSGPMYEVGRPYPSAGAREEMYRQADLIEEEADTNVVG